MDTQTNLNKFGVFPRFNSRAREDSEKLSQAKGSSASKQEFIKTHPNGPKINVGPAGREPGHWGRQIPVSTLCLITLKSAKAQSKGAAGLSLAFDENPDLRVESVKGCRQDGDRRDVNAFCLQQPVAVGVKHVRWD